RRYMGEVSDPPPEHRVLAARAEVGWGAWPEARQLLTGVPGLDTHESGIGLYLLARALDHAGVADSAAAMYRTFLALSPPAGEMEDERAAARLRLGLVLTQAGDRIAAREPLRLSAGRAGDAAIWLQLLEADALARGGDTAAVRQAVASHTDGIAGLRA